MAHGLKLGQRPGWKRQQDMTIEGKILIVDDQEDNLRVLYHYLRHRGYRIYVATNGETGLNLAVIRCPDLILLDIVMPGMDGFATCECLKSRQETRDIPVIFLSALADRESKLKGLRTGAVDYINKPFEIEEVLARVATHINLHCLQGRLREQNQLLKQQSRMLEEQASVARQVSQAKSSLMAVATHDLRQPLHALNLLVETLESRTDNPRLRKL
ncbi:MAG: response regulator, partial [Gammaproteobacteria bacterium]|nr:response regulator [Gammaproteobacteria bacterium]